MSTVTAERTHLIVSMTYTEGRWRALCACGQPTVAATVDEVLDAFADHQDTATTQEAA